MKRNLILWMTLILFVAAPFAAAQEGEGLTIVASHSILADVVANVAGDAATVTSLMPIGADPHTFVPTPRDLTQAADADVIFINGAFFEEGLLRVIENLGDDANIVTASLCVRILPFGITAHSHDHDDHDHDHDHDDHDHDDHDHDDHDHDDHDHDDHDHDDHDHDDHDHDDHDHDDHDHDDHEMSAIAERCAGHYAEMAAIHAASHDHDHDDHDHDNHDHDDHDHDDHDHDDHDHDHSHREISTPGPLYALDCGDGHSHDHDHDDHDDHDHDHSHAEGSCDPHVWTEPHNVMYWVMQIRDTLIELDPANAETYTANAAAYLEILDDLAHDFIMPMVETLPQENRILVTNHETLGYFAASYGFELVGTVIPGGGTAAEPSAAAIATLIDLIREENVTAIFAENIVSDTIAQRIAEETGAQVVLLYSDSLSAADGPAATYVDYIRYNVTAIVQALGGGM